jgi:hypothetical protein
MAQSIDTEYHGWPSRKPVWGIGALFLAMTVAVGVLYWQQNYEWTFLQRYYLSMYLKTWVRSDLFPKSSGRYALIDAVNAHAMERMAVGNEAEQVTDADGTPAYVVTDQARRNGVVRLSWNGGEFNNQKLHAYLRHWIYLDKTAWDLVRTAVWWGCGAFVLGLFVAIPRDRKRQQILRHGRRLCGPELVGTIDFNQKLTRRKWLMEYPPDGLAFINEARSWFERTFRNNASRWVRIPRDREAKHLLVVGDSGNGKSATIRQVLSQIAEREETAIVYDPAMEYLPQFYDPARGDVILNPLDSRCPFWTPGDEVQHPAEALALAASLFPDQEQGHRFFVDAPRKIFAHLLNLKPSPQELTAWMANAEEIDQRVKGTELAAMIDPSGGPQRSGVLGSLNMVADALKLLPRENETRRRWSAAKWAEDRKGWVFLTSKPIVRERLRPLISLWLDLLVLRTMEDGLAAKRKTWFVLDELASLQRLPQLTTAITESRKSDCPIVLGFQGKAQIEVLYGHITEALLSQPMTKIFLKTSEPNAGEWISKAIGEIKIERYRETRTYGQFPQSQSTASQQYDISREPLVMASEISGLEPLHGYLKHGNYVVPLQVPYINLENHHEKFIERRIDPQDSSSLYAATSTELPSSSPQGTGVNPEHEGQKLYFE